MIFIPEGILIIVDVLLASMKAFRKIVVQDQLFHNIRAQKNHKSHFLIQPEKCKKV